MIRLSLCFSFFFWLQIGDLSWNTAVYRFYTFRLNRATYFVRNLSFLGFIIYYLVFYFFHVFRSFIRDLNFWFLISYLMRLVLFVLNLRFSFYLRLRWLFLNLVIWNSLLSCFRQNFLLNYRFYFVLFDFWRNKLFLCFLFILNYLYFLIACLVFL